MKKLLPLICVIMLIFSLIIPSAAEEESVVLNSRSDFLWGQNMHTNNRGYDAPDKYSEESLHLAAQMGVKLLRYQGNYIHQDFTEADQIIGLCNQYGIKVMLCLFPDVADEPTQEDLDLITHTTKTYAERYNGKNGRGKVDFFQLWNEEEIELQAAKYGGGATAGQSINNYFTESVEGKEDLVEWAKFMKAGAKGIREADTDAKIVINFSWVAFGCIRYYVKENVDFDYIGWDWYAQTFDPEQARKNFEAAMYGGVIKTGTNNSYDVVGLRQVIPDKDVIICESNTWVQGYANHGGYSDENMTLTSYQPLFEQMKLAYQQDWMKGYCAFKLTDSPNHPVVAEQHYGFVSVKPGGEIIGPKPIYYEYQNMTGGLNQVKKLLKSSVDLKPYEVFKVKTKNDSDQIQPETQTVVVNPVAEDPSGFDSFTGDFSDEGNDTVQQVEPTVETTLIKPDDIYKKAVSTITHKKIPWVIIISASIGMAVLFAGGLTAFFVLKKRKAKMPVDPTL